MIHFPKPKLYCGYTLILGLIVFAAFVWGAYSFISCLIYISAGG